MIKKTKSASFTVSMMIVAMLISKILGMLRGVLLAAIYDISESATAFSAASRIPLSFFDIIFASAILGCFIPVYSSFNSADAVQEKNKFTSIYLNFLLLLTGIFALFGMIFAKQLIRLVAPGLIPETEALATLLLRIMFPMIVFAAASYTFVGFLQSNDSYIVPAFISAVSNVFIIIYFIFFNTTFGIKGLAFAYSVSWIIQLLTLIVPVIKSGYSYKLIIDFKNRGFITAMKMTPAIIMGSWLAPFCLLISMHFASLTQIKGAVASFEYSINLFTVITGITTHGVCNYIFPRLSSLANDNKRDFISTGRTGLTSAILMVVPIAAIVYVLAPQGVSIVYRRGNFGPDAASMVSMLLKSLVPGMIGFTLVEFLSRTFYALKKPIFSVIAVMGGIVSNWCFVYITHNVLKLGLRFVGLAYSVGLTVAGLLLILFSSICIKNFYSVKYFINIFKILFSGIFSLLVMYFVSEGLLKNPYNASFAENLFGALFVAFIGLIVYFIGLIITREQNVNDVISSRKKR